MKRWSYRNINKRRDKWAYNILEIMVFFYYANVNYSGFIFFTSAHSME